MSDTFAQPHAIPDRVRDDEVGEKTHPAAPARAATRPPRSHEWTRARMDAFLAELRATQSVWRAARAVGMGRQSAYKLRRRMAAFAADWDSALAASRLDIPGGPLATPSRCPLCGGAPRRALGWEGA